jgi:hypothetical protein
MNLINTAQIGSSIFPDAAGALQRMMLSCTEWSSLPGTSKIARLRYTYPDYDVASYSRFVTQIDAHCGSPAVPFFNWVPTDTRSAYVRSGYYGYPRYPGSYYGNPPYYGGLFAAGAADAPATPDTTAPPGSAPPVIVPVVQPVNAPTVTMWKLLVVGAAAGAIVGAVTGAMTGAVAGVVTRR